MENVQVLASTNSKEIPPLYLQPEVEAADDQDSVVPEEVFEKMKNDTEEFFKLPLEKKKAYAKQPNNIEVYIQLSVSEEKELARDRFFLVPCPVSQRNMRFWPTHPASFRESIDKYSRELRKVTISLLRFMSRNLGVDSETLTLVFEDGRQSLRLSYYPPSVHANKEVALSPHSDVSGLTLLVQANDVQGLQIKKDRKWVLVKPIPGAFIVNIGDMIEMMSNGEYKSIEHRIVMNPEKPRLSIAVFQCPNMKIIIGPIPDLVKENGAKYKSTRFKDYLTMVPQVGELDGKSLIDSMKLKQ